MTTQSRSERTPHGLWRTHRIMRLYRDWCDKQWEWWRDTSKIDRAYTVYLVRNSFRPLGPKELVEACAYRFARRWPNCVRTVEQYNNLVDLICRRGGFNRHQTRKACKFLARPRSFVIAVAGAGGHVRLRFMPWDVDDRAKRIAKIREVKQAKQEVKQAKHRQKMYREIDKTKNELTIIRAAIKSAQLTINGVKHENA